MLKEEAVLGVTTGLTKKTLGYTDIEMITGLLSWSERIVLIDYTVRFASSEGNTTRFGQILSPPQIAKQDHHRSVVLKASESRQQH